jgi:hypothetical protein
MSAAKPHGSGETPLSVNILLGYTGYRAAVCKAGILNAHQQLFLLILFKCSSVRVSCSLCAYTKNIPVSWLSSLQESGDN